MMSFLIQREFFQLTPIGARYEVLPLHSLNLREEYRGIYLGSALVGFNFTVLETAEDAEDAAAYELRHQTYMSFLFLGHEREMLVKGKARLDAQLNLKSLEVRVSSGDYWTLFSGQIANNNLNLVIEGKDGSPVRKIIPVTEAVFFSEALNFIWTPENLKIGKRGRIHVWNPLLMNFENMNFHVSGKESISVEGEEVEVFLVTAEQSGIESRLWINPEGVVLRQESPTGLVIEKEEAWKIFDRMRNNRAKLPDLPNLFSIASNQKISHPEKLTNLKVKLTNREENRILEISKPSLELFDSLPYPLSGDLIPPGDYLAATPWIQSQEPEIVQTAAGITQSARSGVDAVQFLMEWVHRYVSPLPSMGIPSAMEVLHSKKGDCNEYTALFTALARAAGIPTKMIGGLVYQDGRFFYHAWAEVYLGTWIPVDPTFAQFPADATHIPVVEGDIEEQVNLVKIMGQIKLAVLDFHE